LTALATDGQANVLSSPSVLVLDNQTAEINVGTDIAVRTSQQQSVSSGDAPIVNSIQYRQTGVRLSVKPRVTPGGLVMMEIQQEVSNPTGVDEQGNPIFSTRTINSSVAVQSNQAVVLGGLIEDELQNAKGGVPGLYNLPAIGWLFSGSRQKRARRRELVVVLTPQVVQSDKDIEQVTEDFRNKLKGLEGSF
jgi:general secretion pathway protein D